MDKHSAFLTSIQVFHPTFKAWERDAGVPYSDQRVAVPWILKKGTAITASCPHYCCWPGLPLGVDQNYTAVARRMGKGIPNTPLLPGYCLYEMWSCFYSWTPQSVIADRQEINLHIRGHRLLELNFKDYHCRGLKGFWLICKALLSGTILARDVTNDWIQIFPFGRFTLQPRCLSNLHITTPRLGMQTHLHVCQN